MEALGVLGMERKRQRRRMDSLDEHLAEVRRNVTSPLAPPLAGHLDQARLGADRILEEFEERLLQALEYLASDAELIHPTPAIYLESRRNPRIEDDPTDSLILACILDHSQKYPSEPKIFLSENRRDFDTNDEARLALHQAGVRYFADASKCLEYHRVRPEFLG